MTIQHPQQTKINHSIDDLKNPNQNTNPETIIVPPSASINPSQHTVPLTETESVEADKYDDVSSIKITNAQAAAALTWFKFGLNVIPIIPGTKRTAVKWTEWVNSLSPEKITQYWEQHPGNEIGFIVGDNIIVFDADSPESIAALAKLEAESCLGPKLVVTTTKGQHHYYRREKNTIAKTDTHGTEEHPERIDVKTGRSMIILPPSTGKTIQIGIATDVSQLTAATQEFIDAVFLHNGREPPRQLKLTFPPSTHSEPQDLVLKKLRALLEKIDPDCGYEDWLHVLMAIFHETGGNGAGLKLADEWSSRGNKYNNLNELKSKWNSFRSGIDKPITIATICKMVNAGGNDSKAICDKVTLEINVQDSEFKTKSKDGCNLEVHPINVSSDQNAKSTALPNDAESIAILASMKPMEYDRIRLEKAKELGVQVKTLDAQVKELRNEKTDDGNLIFPEVEPYPEPISLSSLLDEITAIIRRFVILDPEQADTAALWIAHTYLIDIFDISPLAIINAPEKACAKTLFQTLLARMSYRPLPAANASASALFRAIESWKPTIFFDEADTFFRNNFDLQGLVNAGYKRGGFVLRSESTGDNFEPRMFSVYSAKSIAGISLEKHLPDSTMSRGIIFNMRRKLSNETVIRMRHSDSGVFDVISSKLIRFALDYSQQVRLARPSLPNALSDRSQDNWEALLAIAECAGVEWLQRATTAALMLSSVGEASVSTGNELLADIRDIFESKCVEKISSVELIEALVADDESPWATYNRGKPITPRQLAKLLAGYGIKSKTVRLKNGYTPKGYDTGLFADAFNRYLPQKFPQQHNVSSESNSIMAGCVTDKTQHGCFVDNSITLEPLPDPDCGDVSNKTTQLIDF